MTIALFLVSPKRVSKLKVFNEKQKFPRLGLWDKENVYT
ncbi:hypothetical protein SAMN05660745_01073 [Corynebacterium glucuronolyticum]|nr:hypothetical protein CGLUCO_02400 [Corynebacterium glucuronolyticum DSM 44120]SMB83907.1 hypothetical protein SAMN05660745_01073 [Corynebacterium glucuronolyticum]